MHAVAGPYRPHVLRRKLGAGGDVFDDEQAAAQLATCAFLVGEAVVDAAEGLLYGSDVVDHGFEFGGLHGELGVGAAK